MYGNTYFNEFQILAAQGFAVLYTNPRGSHGYGQNLWMQYVAIMVVMIMRT